MSATIDFQCPACAAPARARAELAGRSVRCKHCKTVFAVPTPGVAESTTYDLAEPEPVVTSMPAAATAPGPGGSTFQPTFREGPSPPPRDIYPKKKKRRKQAPRDALGDFWADRRVKVLAGLAAVGGALVIATFLIPGFLVIGGWTLCGMGTLLVAVGYLVGAYAAFMEDFLYGFVYLVFPLYTGYYLVSRWDDLWPWFSASTVGFLIFLAGTTALQASLAG